mmetsp:Transcript_29850/g.86692  ORF Transcript_29850/g.86692 Transcript_29850/m.86692 type:complete len:219 (+) Transcript_29850:598-1254(+)
MGVVALQVFQGLSAAASEGVENRLPEVGDVLPEPGPGDAQAGHLRQHCPIRVAVRVRVHPLAARGPKLHQGSERRDAQSMQVQAHLVLLEQGGVALEVVRAVGQDEPGRGRPIVPVAADVMREQLRPPLGRVDREPEVHQAPRVVPARDFQQDVPRGDVAVVRPRREVLQRGRELLQHRAHASARLRELARRCPMGLGDLVLDLRPLELLEAGLEGAF